MLILTKTFLKNPGLSYLSKILLASLFVAASAQICIPFHPVPMTMQVAAVMIIGLLSSPSVAAGTILAYIMEAAVGLPVLSNFTGGIPHLLGTRGGYIFGYILLAWIVSMSRHLSENPLSKVMGCVVGNVVLYGMGVSWLSTFIGFEKGLQFGLYLFLWEIPLYIGFSLVCANLLRLYAFNR